MFTGFHPEQHVAIQPFVVFAPGKKSQQLAGVTEMRYS
jgi:hypothetical protein